MADTVSDVVTAGADAAAAVTVPTKSIFARVVETAEDDAEAVWQEAKAEALKLYTDDVKPVFSAMYDYIRQNGEADLILLAKMGMADLISMGEAAIASGGNPAAISTAAVAATVGTIVDKGKSLGLQIATGAATLALNMAAAQVNASESPTNVAAVAVTQPAAQ